MIEGNPIKPKREFNIEYISKAYHTQEMKKKDEKIVKLKIENAALKTMEGLIPIKNTEINKLQARIKKLEGENENIKYNLDLIKDGVCLICGADTQELQNLKSLMERAGKMLPSHKTCFDCSEYMLYCPYCSAENKMIDQAQPVVANLLRDIEDKDWKIKMLKNVVGGKGKSLEFLHREIEIKDDQTIIRANEYNKRLAEITDLVHQLEQVKKERDEAEQLTLEQGAKLGELLDIKARCSELTEYCVHERDCLCSQWREGRPTKDGDYETLYGYGNRTKWYRRNEKPECSCGLNKILDAINNHIEGV